MVAAMCHMHTSKSTLCIVRMGVTRVASLNFALVDLRQTAMQVALQLA